MRHIIGTVLTAFVLAMVGCGPVPKTPFITEPGTTQYAAVADKWQVDYSGAVQIKQDKDGVVHIYGIAKSPNTCTVVLSGSVVFKVYGCNVVFVREGVTADCISCGSVSADNGSTVAATNCSNVRAANGSKVSAFGSTVVNREPAPAAPADKK